MVSACNCMGCPHPTNCRCRCAECNEPVRYTPGMDLTPYMADNPIFTCEPGQYKARAYSQPPLRGPKEVLDSLDKSALEILGGYKASETVEDPEIGEELEVLIECMRTSAQQTLQALHRKGWRLTRG